MQWLLDHPPPGLSKKQKRLWKEVDEFINISEFLLTYPMRRRLFKTALDIPFKKVPLYINRPYSHKGITLYMQSIFRKRLELRV